MTAIPPLFPDARPHRVDKKRDTDENPQEYQGPGGWNAQVLIVLGVFVAFAAGLCLGMYLERCLALGAK